MVAFASMAGAALPALVGGIFAKGEEQRGIKAAKRAAKKDFQRLRKIRAEDRRFYLGDRDEAREYAAGQLADDRAYAARQLASDRAYAERMLASDRLYAEKQLGKTTAEARAYAEAQRALAERRFKADRASMQDLADSQAERSALTRGIDFRKLRDDAIAAGFNPLTAMSMAHAYSTEVGYGTVGDVYGGGGELTAGISAPSPGVGGGSYPMSGGGPMSAGGVAPGGFSTSGMGYSGTQLPPLMSSAGFIAEAVARGVDTWLNSPPPQDLEAQAVMRQVQASIIRQEAEASTPRPFGYDLTRIAPYRPAVGYGTGALSSPYLGDLRDGERAGYRDDPAYQYVTFPDDGRRIMIRNPDVWGEPGEAWNAGVLADAELRGPMRPRARPLYRGGRDMPVMPGAYPNTGVEFHGPVFGSGFGVP